MITTYPSKVTHKSFFTDEDGNLILPEALKLGNYRIEEIAAPYGYVVNETYETIITVDYEDAPVVGELTVEKKGEVLDSYNKGGLFTDSDEKSFVYREGSLADAKYEVYAAEDIFTADMQKFGLYADEDIRNVDGKVIIEAGTLLETAVSDENGITSFTKDYPYGYLRATDIQFTVEDTENIDCLIT